MSALPKLHGQIDSQFPDSEDKLKLKEALKECVKWAELAKYKWYYGSKNMLHDSHDIAEGISKSCTKAKRLFESSHPTTNKE